MGSLILQIVCFKVGFLSELISRSLSLEARTRRSVENIISDMQYSLQGRERARHNVDEQSTSNRIRKCKERVSKHRQFIVFLEKVDYFALFLEKVYYFAVCAGVSIR